MTQITVNKPNRIINLMGHPRHHLTEQSRLAWIDDGKTIRVIPLSKKNPFGRGIARDLDLSRALLADRAKERERERRRRRS